MKDFWASGVVFFISIPLSMGVALSSKMPIHTGIICAIISGIIIWLFSKSHVYIAGPAAGLAIIVGQGLARVGSYENFALALFLAGIIQLFLGFIKAGSIGHYFPTSVVKGMLSSIGIIFILKQIPHLLGHDTTLMGDESFFQTDGTNTISSMIAAFQSFTPSIFILSLLSLFCVAKYKWGSLYIIILSVLSNEILLYLESPYALTSIHLLNFESHKGLVDFLDSLHFPDWHHIFQKNIWITSIHIAFFASIEAMFVFNAIEKIDPNRRSIDRNWELKVHGMGNMLLGLLGGLPMTGLLMRTSANIHSGGNSKRVSLFVGLWFVLLIIFIPEYLSKIPLAGLAAILAVLGFKLAKFSDYTKMYKRGPNHFIPFIVTIISVVFSDLMTGMFLGTIVGIYFVIKNNIRKSIVFVHDENYYLVKFTTDISFVQKNNLLDTLDKIPDGANVIIDGSKGIFIDDEIIDVIEDFMYRSEQKKIRVEVVKSINSLSPYFKQRMA